MRRFKNKYRSESARLKNWDYGSNAAYFVTICTQGRQCFFGHVGDNEMMLNGIGEIARDCWTQIPTHFPFVKLGEHVVMPNHVHGIVIIDKTDDGRNDHSNKRDVPNVETPKLGVSTITNRTNAASEKWNSGTLGAIINQYKRAVTIRARKIHPNFTWQSRYHDHIIRNNPSYHRISEYIKNNPAVWQEDTLR